MGSSDHAYTIEEAQELYELIPGPSKELVFYDCGHNLSVDYVSKAVEWFKEHL